MKTLLHSTLATVALGLAMIFAFVLPARSNLSEYISFNGTLNRYRWDFTAFPVVWHANTARGNLMLGQAAPAAVVESAFTTWIAAPNVALQVSRGGDTSLNTSGADGTNLVCFTCQGDFSHDLSTLAVTLTFAADSPGAADLHGGSARFAGQILDADILFNPGVCFSTGAPGTCSNGKASADLQTIALHEIGHFFGLDHSAVVQSVMFPFSPDMQRTLSLDDVAGMAESYPKTTPDFATGTISGSVHFASGGAVLGAHVYAESTTAAMNFAAGIRKSPIGTLSLNDGSYTLSQLPADSYRIAVEPLDDPVTNSNVPNFAPLFNKQSVDAAFNTTFF